MCRKGFENWEKPWTSLYKYQTMVHTKRFLNWQLKLRKITAKHKYYKHFTNFQVHHVCPSTYHMYTQLLNTHFNNPVKVEKKTALFISLYPSSKLCIR